MNHAAGVCSTYERRKKTYCCCLLVCFHAAAAAIGCAAYAVAPLDLIHHQRKAMVVDLIHHQRTAVNLGVAAAAVVDLVHHQFGHHRRKGVNWVVAAAAVVDLIHTAVNLVVAAASVVDQNLVHHQRGSDSGPPPTRYHPTMVMNLAFYSGT